MDFCRSSQLKFLLMELLYLIRFRCASCYLFSRHELKYPLIQTLLEYMKGLSCDSESDDDFDGYLGPEDGPVACTIVPEVVERDGLCSPVRRSRALDRRPYAAEVSEFPESPFTSSVSPMQGQHSSGSPLSLTSETNSSHSTILTLQLNQILRYAKIHYDTYMLRT